MKKDNAPPASSTSKIPSNGTSSSSNNNNNNEVGPSASTHAPPLPSLERRPNHRPPGAFAMRRGMSSAPARRPSSNRTTTIRSAAAEVPSPDHCRGQRNRTLSAGTVDTSCGSEENDDEGDDASVTYNEDFEGVFNMNYGRRNDGNDPSQTTGTGSTIPFRVPVAELVVVALDGSMVSSLDGRSAARNTYPNNFNTHHNPYWHQHFNRGGDSSVMEDCDIEIAQEVYRGEPVRGTTNDDMSDDPTTATTQHRHNLVWFRMGLGMVLGMVLVVAVLLLVSMERNGGLAFWGSAAGGTTTSTTSTTNGTDFADPTKDPNVNFGGNNSTTAGSTVKDTTTEKEEALNVTTAQNNTPPSNDTGNNNDGSNNNNGDKNNMDGSNNTNGDKNSNVGGGDHSGGDRPSGYVDDPNDDGYNRTDDQYIRPCQDSKYLCKQIKDGIHEFLNATDADGSINSNSTGGSEDDDTPILSAILDGFRERDGN